MLAVSRQFWATPLCRREERILTFLSPAPLGVAVALAFCVPTKARVLSISRWTQGLTIHLFGTCSPQLLLRTPRSSGRQAAHSSARFLSSVHRMTRAHLHNGLAQLRVIPVLAQHQIQPRGQLARHRYFRQPAMLAHRQATIKAAQLGIVTRRR